ncbi:MAG: Hpt domain-containing protein, partial [Fimbriiglobus sp.]|nr:Hpt domain-containing protein [Fimbriiglobus sp.]
MRIDPERYKATFFEEARDHLADLEGALLRLDARPDDAEAVDAAFRAAHTLKGGADLVGLGPVARFAHGLETLLDQFRGGRAVPRRVLDLLLEATDTLARLVTAASTNDPLPPGTDGLLARLLGQPERAPSVVPSSSPVKPAGLEYLVTITPHPDAFRNGLDPLALIREVLEHGTGGEVRANLSGLPSLAELDPERCYLSWLVRLHTDQPEAVADVFAFAPEMIAASVEPVVPPQASTPIPTPLPSSTANAPDPVRLAVFLVMRGVLSAERALDALLQHRNARPLIGGLAVQCGKITVEQLFETLAGTEGGRTFGQVAVSLGYLSQADVAQLLLLQERQTPPLHEVLVSAGLISREQMDTELVAYRGAANTAVNPQAGFSDLPEPEMPPPPGASLLEENGAMIAEFCGEADEHLEVADRHLLTIDGQPTDAEALNAVYRGFHTIKGVAGMLGLEAVQRLAHEAENLLNLARDGKVLLQGRILDLVFGSVDALKRQVMAIRRWSANGGRLEEDPTLPRLLADLTAAVSGRLPADPPPAPEPVMATAPQSASEPTP